MGWGPSPRTLPIFCGTTVGMSLPLNRFHCTRVSTRYCSHWSAPVTSAPTQPGVIVMAVTTGAPEVDMQDLTVGAVAYAHPGLGGVGAGYGLGGAGSGRAAWGRGGVGASAWPLMVSCGGVATP